MGAPKRYPVAHTEQLFLLAVRAREAGLDFELFWLEAIRPGQKPITWAVPEQHRPLGCVVWPRDTEDRETARRSVMDPAVKEAWRAAYMREPERSVDRAVRIVLAAFEDAGSDVVEPLERAVLVA